MSVAALPPAWDVHRRLLSHGGRPAWLVDGDGVVVWASGEAAAGQRLADTFPGFVPGTATVTAQGRLLCEAIAGGWAVILEPAAPDLRPEQILDLVPVPLFWKDRAGIYRGCNQAFADFLCRPVAEIVGRDVHGLSPPDLADKYQAMDDELMAAGPDAVQRYEWDVHTKSGGLRHVLFHKANLLDGRGTVAGLVGMVLDVTELHQMERKFSTVFRACPDIITITERATGRYLDVNDAFVACVGLPKDEVVGRTSLELGVWVCAEDRQALLAALAVTGRLSNFETRFRRHDGSVFTALLSADSTELDGVPCVILVVRDISERKSEEMVLRRTAEELHRSNAELERFAYVAAHDLQEPCRTICSFAQLLERRCGDALGADGREYLTYLSDGAQRMRELVQGLLSYSRVDRNTVRFEPVELSDLVASALSDLSSAIAQAGAEIRVGTLPPVRGDAVQLRQVFTNLIGNALKFQPAGQVPVVEVAAHPGEGCWLITVRDNGIGIAPEYAEEVFGMFRRLHGGGAYPGTGIGLALVKRVVEAHGGRVWVDSTPGKGCTFCLTLPA